jgi:hypothetical protein
VDEGVGAAYPKVDKLKKVDKLWKLISRFTKYSLENNGIKSK